MTPSLMTLTRGWHLLPCIAFLSRGADALNSDALRTCTFTVGFHCINAIGFGAIFPATVLPLLGVAAAAAPAAAAP